MTQAAPMTHPREADWPNDDDWERINCPKAGLPGHTQCGWCPEHGHPNFRTCPARVQPQEPAHE